MEISVDQFEEAKKANQKWKYSNGRTSESWQKVGMKPAKDQLSRELRKAL